ncbi:MAG TPA: hypothetical protein VN048_12710 [Verrucomicrobiae bacterium]|nr:hypothetical protein [Verrucomicrobiae bacterium]
MATIPGNNCLHTSQSASHPKRTTAPIITTAAHPMRENDFIREKNLSQIHEHEPTPMVRLVVAEIKKALTGPIYKG